MSLALNSLALQAQASTYSWVKTTFTGQELTEGSDLCAGIDANPTTWEGFTSVAVGPCTTAVTGPPVYIEQDFVDVITVSNADDYLTARSFHDNAVVVDPHTFQDLSAGKSTPAGYRDFSAVVTEGTAKYAYVQTGGFFGKKPLESGAYIGTANYLVTDGTVSTNKNKFYVGATPGEASVKRGNSDIGAPHGPFVVCISPLKDGTCGDPRVYKEGHFKFSIYGYTIGTAYKGLPKTSAGVQTTEYGMRMKLSLKNEVGHMNLHFNNDDSLTLDKLGHKNVESFTLTTGTLGTLTYEFPQTYNVGNGPAQGSMTVPTPTATKAVKIRVSPVSGSATSVYVDYLFDGADFATAGKYFVYDPSIKSSPPAAETSGATSSATTVAVALLGVAATATLF